MRPPSWLHSLKGCIMIAWLAGGCVMRACVALMCVVLCGACAQETIRFAAKPDQQAITRDGQPAVISQKPHTLVMIRPAFRKFARGERPVFVVAVRNLGT